MSFLTVKYGYDSDVLVEVDMTDLPEKHVIVRTSAYFADESGYVMFCRLDDALRAMHGKYGPDTFVAQNCFWHDLVSFNGITPKEVIEFQESVSTALTVLEWIDCQAVFEAAQGFRDNVCDSDDSE